MKLPADSIIPLEKLTRYLLVPQKRADKSAFLLRGGYQLENANQLLDDLRSQILALDAVPAGSTKFGNFFQIRGVLHAPNGKKLRVKTIWMREHLRGVVRFITLLPDKIK
jgi:hypothetical protein